MKTLGARRASSWLSLLLAAAAVLGVTALLPGCCTTTEEDVCALMDYSQDECPSASDFSTLMGGNEVKSGPEEKYYVDLRESVKDQNVAVYGMYGRLCCYRVKYESCDSISIGKVY